MPKMWPQGDPSIIFPDIIYKFTGYKKLWRDIMNVDGKEEVHYTRFKLGETWTTQRQRQCEWLQQWWNDYGLNKTTMDPSFF